MSDVNDYAQRLSEGAAPERPATIKLGAETVAILEKLRRPTEKADGRPGRLQSLCEVAQDLILIANQTIEEKAAGQGKRQGKPPSTESPNGPAKQ